MKNNSLKQIETALAWERNSHAILSFVGAGGKTSLMYAFADDFAAAGLRVIVTTTTHIFYPEEREVRLFSSVEGRGAEAVTEKPWSGVLVVGERTELSRHGEVKLVGIAEKAVQELAHHCDVLLVEADGARHMPLKVPAAHEPVIPAGTAMVIGCAGLDSIGKTLESGCFRLPEAMELLGKQAKDLITPKDVARILTHPSGTRKQVGDSAYCIALNKADGEKEKRLAAEVIREIQAIRNEQVIVTRCQVTEGSYDVSIL